jgi:multicomponent Na+:H+ antiporter subunit B
MNSIIVRATARLMLPLLLLLAIFLLLRGHHEPGGGFAGGLVAATAIILLAMAGGLREAETIVPIATAWRLLALGLLIATISAIVPLLLGQAFMQGLWLELELPGWGPVKVGTPLLFDVGVGIVVVGMVLTVVLRLIAEVELW